MITRFRDSYLAGTSDCFNSAGELKGYFDVFLTASSWDSRCISITKAQDVKLGEAMPMYFDVRDTLGLRDKHDKILSDYCKQVSERTTSIHGSSRDVQLLWSKIHTGLIKIAEERKRPLHLLLDISTCPRYYASAVCAVGLVSGLMDKITVFYAEATYPEGAATEIAFTGGRWQTVPIPGLLGRYQPESKRFYFVSVGFEGWKTLRVVARADPDRVSVLIPDPGVIPEYVEKAYNHNSELFDSYKIPEDQIVRAHAADAIGVWKALSAAALERQDENSYFLCCGTKPHSLAFALRALSLGFPTVLYNVPDEHKVVLTEPNGKFWRYVIEDVTAFPSE
jgi:hypothetical protein